MSDNQFKIVVAIGGLILGCVLFTGVITLNAFNADANLRTRVEALQKNQEVTFDTMRKVISQKKELPAAAKADLIEMLPMIVAGRSGGSVFKQVQEQYPDFNMALYRDLSRTIEAQRESFLHEQQRLFDAQREHTRLLRTPISGTILSMVGRKPVEVTVVSSTNAKATMQTGLEDD